MGKTFSYGKCKWRTIFIRRIYGSRWKEKLRIKDLLDRKALGSIRLCLTPSVAFNITKVKTIEELMQILAKLYEKSSASNKVFLINFLFNMKMIEGGSIVDHLNEFNTITSQLS